jgi:aromatic-amino-acid transaminase
LLFGQNALVIEEKRSKTAQAPGGTGALRLAGEFIRRQLGDVKIWISKPTWANHIGVFQAANLNIEYYRYYDAETRSLDFDGLLTDLEQAKAGDVVLLHGCCHNPTGIDPTQEQWQTLVNVCQQKGLLPLFDFAYQGFASGVEQDAQGLRTFVKTGMEVLIASSFSKNFGLYNERVGAFTLVARNAQEAETAFSQIKSIARVIYSNPPAHGSAIVSYILQNTKRRQAWENEVTEMRNRIKEMRTLFVQTLKEHGVETDFQFIEEQNGMFSFSGLTPDQVSQLQKSFAIYIVGSGRISVAGMTKENMQPLCRGIAEVLAK